MNFFIQFIQKSLEEENMRKIAIILLMFLFGLTISAETIKVLGIDISSTYAYRLVPSLTNVSFTKVSKADFATVDLSQYDVLFIAETFTNGSVSTYDSAAMNALKARENDIATWLSQGHGIVALSEPLGASFDWLPNTIQPTTGAGGADNIYIQNSLHPVFNNLNNAGLSNWSTSSHGVFTSTGGLEVLATNGGSGYITLAGNYGAGRVVLTTQDPDWHYPTGNTNLIFLQNMIDWTAGASTIPEPNTSIAFLFGLIFFIRKFRNYKR